MPGKPSQLQTPVNAAFGTWCFHLPAMNNHTTGDVLTNFVPGFAGAIYRTFAVIVTAVTSGSTCSQAYNLEINSANLVGGVVSVITNAAVATYIAGTAVVGGNVFDIDDTISLECTRTTAATAGAMDLVVVYITRVRRG